MPRRTLLIVDHGGARLGILKALREQWTPGEQLVVRGRSYHVAALVELEQPDRSGATAMLIVAEPPASTT
jgi:hypothetical protein